MGPAESDPETASALFCLDESTGITHHVTVQKSNRLARCNVSHKIDNETGERYN